MASRLPQSLEAPRPGGRVGCLHPGEAAPAHRSPRPSFISQGLVISSPPPPTPTAL